MAAWIWIVIIIAVVAVVALGAMVARNRRTAMLRDRFGPEYDRTVANRDDRRAAETELLARQKQRAQFDVRPLPEADRLRFTAEWRDLQEGFLDEPAQSVAAADALITRVMEARGYPMRDFDAQTELVSVDYPETVENYRFAHAVQLRAQDQQASTEELREATLRYRSLFDELLRPDGDDAAAITDDDDTGITAYDDAAGTTDDDAAGITAYDDAAGTTVDQAQPASLNGGQRVTPGPDAQVPEFRATRQADDPEFEEGDSLADPAASDPDYRDQQIGR
jgi:hypothetical protein